MGLKLGLFSTGTETAGCAGISGEGENTKPGNGACIGLILPKVVYPSFSGIPYAGTG